MDSTPIESDRARAQSETVGVVLLTGIIIISVSAASVMIVANFTQQADGEGGEGAAIDVALTVTADDLTITHSGGNAVAESSIQIVVRASDGERQYALATDPIERDGDGDDRFEPGESATVSLPNSWTGIATVSVIDTDRNVVITRREVSIPVDTTIDPANFAVRIENTNSPVVEGETVVVRPRISNTGDVLGTQTINLSVGGTVVDSDLVTTEASESEQIELRWPTSVGENGTYSVTVSSENSTATESVTVLSEPYFAVRIDNTNSPVIEGENISVDTTVENTGGAPDIQNIALNVTGQTNPVDIENIGINPSDSWPLTLSWPTADGDAGTYDATVSSDDDSATASVTVDPPNVPTVISLLLDGAPINYTEAGTGNRALTIRYSESMNQSIDPTVTFTGQSVSDGPTDDGWINNTTYVKRVDIRQNSNDEETVTVSVSGAEDTDGNTQTDASASFLVDTQRPGDVTTVVTKPDINASTQGAVTYGIQNPDTLYGDEDMRVTLTGPNGQTVTQRTPIQAGGDNVTDVTFDASSLADGNGTVSISAVAIDDVNNTGAAVTESGITKDTVAPLVTNYAVTSDNNREFTVTFDATEETTTVDDVSISVTGPGSATRISSNNVTSGDTTSFSLTYSVDVNGQYDVKLVRVLDSVGNNGSSGETETVDTQGGGSGTVADANGPYTVDEGGSITLDGSASTQGNNVEYNWTIVSGPGTITDADINTPNATYIAPSDVTDDTTVTVELTVTDNQGTDSTTTTVTVRDLGPRISNYAVTNPQDRDIRVSFDADESLSDINVTLTRDGSRVAVLDETDITTSDTAAPYTYTGTYTVSSAGTYDATLNVAADADGNDGASGESDTATVVDQSNAGTIAGTVTAQGTSNPLENVDITVYEAGTTTVVTTALTNASGQYAVDVPGGSNYDVEANGSDIGYDSETTTGVSVTTDQTTTSDFQLQPVSVFARSDDWNANNDDIDTSFDVVSGGTTISFSVVLDGANDGGSQAWNTKTVTIDGTTYTLTDNAASRITSGTDTDLLNASNYVSVDQATLDQTRQNVNLQSRVANLNNAGKRTLTPTIQRAT